MRKHFLRTLLILCAVLLIGAAACLLARRHIAKSVTAAYQAERWAGESGMDFAQFSVFYGDGGSAGLEQIYALRQKLNESFVNEGIQLEGAGDLFCDAWSAMGKLHVACDRADSDAEAMAVGGSFFDFHPMEILSGSYLRANAQANQVVLDELLAWLLFGSSNVAGMEVEIGGQPYEIVGVVRQDDSRAVQQFRSASPTVYLPYATYQNLYKTGISCYEITLPEPVKGYAEGVLSEEFPVGNGILQKVTGRFSLSASWELLKSFPLRGTQTQAVALPYWENAARYEENRCALWLFAALWLLAIPGVCAVVAVVWLWLLARKGLIKGAPKAVRGVRDGAYALSTKLSRRKKRD